MTSFAEGDTAQLEECPGCRSVNASDSRFCARCGLALADVHGAVAVETVADPLVGRVIAERYKILSLVGRGGMGVVYKVEHVHIGKLMAVKLLHGELSRDKDTMKRFKREAEAASHLNHPNTVQIFDFGRDEGLTYLVMEYLDGHDLGWVIQHESPLSFARVARICAQACGSIGQAHGAGVVHRDVKPENIMIVQGREAPDMVKVLDFGLAKLRHTESGQTLTRAGSIIGTPYYMAPEHIRGEDVDGRSDVYSLGAVMYKAVTGVPPFWAPSPMGVLTKHLTDDLVLPRERSGRRDLPPEVDSIISKAMRREPEDRYQSMPELRAELAAYLASIGEELSDSSMSFPKGAPMTTDSGRREVVEVATRGDIDHYEKRLKRKGWIGRAVLVLALGGAVAGAAYAFEHRPSEYPSDQEIEPNHEPGIANALPPDFTIRAQLGKRRSPLEGDLDVFVIDNPGGARRVMSFVVGAIPNMDIAVDVVKAGIENPVLVADSAGVGGSEEVPNFPLGGSTYYLRVREVRESGSLPSENVSDDYTVSWTLVAPGEEDEREVNDTLELAEGIEVGVPRRGFVGWAGDTDVYCAIADAGAVVARLGAVRDVDLVLRVVDRRAASSEKVDDGGIGAGEEAQLASVLRRMTCFEVSADDQGAGAVASATTPYVLTLEETAAPPEPDPDAVEEVSP